MWEEFFRDHGGGSLAGYGYDQHFAGSSMALDEILGALRKAGTTFDWIGFDACLMGALETAVVIEPHANYMIASEEVAPGIGWHYTGWLTTLGQMLDTYDAIGVEDEYGRAGQAFASDAFAPFPRHTNSLPGTWPGRLLASLHVGAAFRRNHPAQPSATRGSYEALAP